MSLAVSMGASRMSWRTKVAFFIPARRDRWARIRFAVDTDTNAVFGIAQAEVPVYYTLLCLRNFVPRATFDF